MILDRYIAREILIPQVGVFSVLGVIYSGFGAVRLLNDVVNGLLPAKTVAVLVFLKLLIAFEVIFPVTFFLSIILALGRLHAENEVTAFEACGISRGRITWSVILLSVPLSALVALLSFHVRPWAYERLYGIEAAAQGQFDLAKIEPGRFYEIGGGRVFFCEKMDHGKGEAEGVYVWEKEDHRRKVTHGLRASQMDAPEGRSLVFQKGVQTVLGGDETVLTIQFDKGWVRLKPPRASPIERRVKAAETSRLLDFGVPKAVAEYEWRVSTGPSLLLLSLLAVFLGLHVQGRDVYGRATIGILAFFVYYILALIAKTGVEKGLLAAFPGVWMVDILLAAVVSVLFFRPLIRLRAQPAHEERHPR